MEVLMKKILVLGLFLLCANVVMAQDAIYTTADGTKLKCTATRDSGTYYEYKDGLVDYYDFKKGKLYSSNLSKKFGNPNYKKRVMKLNITEDSISFKDRLYRWGASHYKWVDIDRHTGNYTFEAKKQYNWAWYYQKAYGKGTCEIVK